MIPSLEGWLTNAKEAPSPRGKIDPAGHQPSISMSRGYISALLGNNPNKFLYVNKVKSLSFPVISIHFALEKEIGEIVILKKHAETLPSILKWNKYYILFKWNKQVTPEETK